LKAALVMILFTRSLEGLRGI